MQFVGNKTPLYDKGVKLSNLTTTKSYKMSIKSLTIEQRKGLKKHLVHGDLKRVAKKLNLSNSAIHGFFNGKSNNPEILDELLKLLRKYAKNREDIGTILGKINAE